MNNEEIIWDDDVVWDDATPKTTQPQEKGFFSRVGEDLSKRWDTMTSGELYDKSYGNPVLQTYNTVGQVAGGVLDVATQGLRSAYQTLAPKKLQENVSFLGNELMSSPVGDVIKTGAEKYGEFAESNPEAAQFIESSGNVASVVPIKWGASLGLRGAKGIVPTLREGKNIVKDTGKFMSSLGDEGLQKGLSDTVPITSRYSQRAQIVPNRVKSSTDMKRFYEAEDVAVRQIVKDKNDLVFTDNTGNVITKQLPETVAEWNQAIPQIKQNVLSKAKGLLKDADTKGGFVSTQPVVDTLQTIKKSDLYTAMSQHPKYDTIRKEIDVMIDRYTDKKKMTLSETEADIQAMNKLVGSQIDPLADIAMFDVLKTQRTSLDSAITELSGAGFSDLKKTWGALKEIEPRVAQKANTLSREAGRLNFWDIASLTEGGMGLVSLNPKIIALAGATKLSKEAVKWYNNPNRYVKNMFKKVEDKMNPEYKSKTFNLRQANSVAQPPKKLGKSPHSPAPPPMVIEREATDFIDVPFTSKSRPLWEQPQLGGRAQPRLGYADFDVEEINTLRRAHQSLPRDIIERKNKYQRY